MSARDRILGRLRAARPAEAVCPPEVDTHFAARAVHDDAAGRADRFQRTIEAAHAEVHRVTEAGLPKTLARLLREKRIHRIAVGRATLDDAGLSGAFPASAALLPFTESMERLKPELFHQVDAGFTIAKSAIAETGTLILWPGADEPRSLSLVPPIHIVLLDAAAIHDSLYSAMRAERWNAGLPTNLVLVSGPSKTADIQQTLAYGAHGPKEVIVLMKGAAR
ncbi:MAG: LUD domain-containing protein [Zoogloea sp.]|nr:LUD domain-containing protein [Zoogloea sp.]